MKLGVSTRRFLTCPGCQKPTHDITDRRQKAGRWGPWSCLNCGASISGRLDGGEYLVTDSPPPRAVPAYRAILVGRVQAHDGRPAYVLKLAESKPSGDLYWSEPWPRFTDGAAYAEMGFYADGLIVGDGGDPKPFVEYLGAVGAEDGDAVEALRAMGMPELNPAAERLVKGLAGAIRNGEER